MFCFSFTSSHVQHQETLSLVVSTFWSGFWYGSRWSQSLRKPFSSSERHKKCSYMLQPHKTSLQYILWIWHQCFHFKKQAVFCVFFSKQIWRGNCLLIISVTSMCMLLYCRNIYNSMWLSICACIELIIFWSSEVKGQFHCDLIHPLFTITLYLKNALRKFLWRRCWPWFCGQRSRMK